MTSPNCAVLSRLTIAALMAAAVVSCTTARSVPEAGPETVTAEMVLRDSPLAGRFSGGDVAQDDILKVSSEMALFLDRHVDRDANQNLKLAQLIYSVIGEDRFLLSYDDSTRTASGTFASRRGNCISFTNMFVAMARDVGLKVDFQEVDIPPDWSMKGETVLLSQHVNALVDLKSALSRVVDFNTLEYNVKNEAEVISDERARAHFYNNIGVEHMLADESEQAFANFKQSLSEEESFSPAWVNIGILYRREGYPDYAEAAYLEALEHDRLNLMAMSNLANLYVEEGDTEQAERYLSRVRSHRMKNPYYRYQLANTAFNEGDYGEAIKNLKMAIRQRDDEDRFYFLLSLSHLMSGDRDEAKRWMEKAEEVSQLSEDQKKYHHKLDLLRNPESGY